MDFRIKYESRINGKEMPASVGAPLRGIADVRFVDQRSPKQQHCSQTVRRAMTAMTAMTPTPILPTFKAEIYAYKDSANSIGPATTLGVLDVLDTGTDTGGGEDGDALTGKAVNSRVHPPSKRTSASSSNTTATASAIASPPHPHPS